MNTLLRSENPKAWAVEHRTEHRELRDVERILEGVLTSLETALPNVLTMLKGAKWDGETLCNLESLAVLTAHVETLRAQLVSALNPAYKEIHDRLKPPRVGYDDGPAWE